MTNNDPWGVSPSSMHKICTELADAEFRKEILTVILERWNDLGSTWRNYYKALVLYEYLLLHGPESHVAAAIQNGNQEDIHAIQRLCKYEHTDSQGKDQGVNVRTRAVAVLKLLEDYRALDSAREAAAINRKIMLSRKQVANGASYECSKQTLGPDSNKMSPASLSNKKNTADDDWGEMVCVHPVGSSNSKLESPSESPQDKALQLTVDGALNFDAIGGDDDFVYNGDFNEFQSVPPSQSQKELSTDLEKLELVETKVSTTQHIEASSTLAGFLSLHSDLVDLDRRNT